MAKSCAQFAGHKAHKGDKAESLRRKLAKALFAMQVVFPFLPCFLFFTLNSNKFWVYEYFTDILWSLVLIFLVYSSRKVTKLKSQNPELAVRNWLNNSWDGDSETILPIIYVFQDNTGPLDTVFRDDSALNSFAKRMKLN